MIDKSQKLQLKKLLSEAILLLCRNGLPINSQFSIEAMIGITLNEDEVFLLSFRETVESSSMESSSKRLTEERDDETAKNSNTGRKHWSGNRTSNSEDFCKSVQQLVDTDNPDQETGGVDFCYDGGLNNSRFGIVIKGEVDQYTTEYSGHYQTLSEDMSNMSAEDDVCQNGFESEAKSDLDGFETSVFGCSPSELVANTPRESSSCKKTVTLTPSAFWPHSHLKGCTRRQTMQRSTGSRYNTSTEQRRRGPVYLESAGESLASVERILSAIYPSTDNQSLRCHICGAELKCRRTLMEHIRGTHLSIYSYHCPDCGLGFKWRSSLKHHRARNCTLPSSVLPAA